jgi:hypothetical protein
MDFKNLLRIRKHIRRLVNLIRYGGFVLRKEREYPDGGSSIYRAISGNGRYRVVRQLFSGIKKPFRIPKKSPHLFTRIYP